MTATMFLRERAEDWMARNPEAMALFERFALELARRGRRFGMKLIVERVRWEVAITTSGADYKIDNSHVAYIARALIRRHPQLADLIEFRLVRA